MTKNQKHLLAEKGGSERSHTCTQSQTNAGEQKSYFVKGTLTTKVNYILYRSTEYIRKSPIINPFKRHWSSILLNETV